MWRVLALDLNTAPEIRGLQEFFGDVEEFQRTTSSFKVFEPEHGGIDQCSMLICIDKNV